MRVDIIETPELGDRSYVVTGGSASVVVDPQRDLDRVCHPARCGSGWSTGGTVPTGTGSRPKSASC